MDRAVDLVVDCVVDLVVDCVVDVLGTAWKESRTDYFKSPAQKGPNFFKFENLLCFLAKSRAGTRN